MLEEIQYHYKKYSNLLKILFENILTSFLQYFLGEDIKKIVKKNREFLKTVGPFLSKNQFQENDYGMDIKIFNNLDKNIKHFPTYSDLLIFVSHFLKKRKIRYLEIGASVLKNTLQVDHSLDDADIVVYDINDLAPNFREGFKIIDNENPNLFFKKTKNFNYYFKGNVLDMEDTKKFDELFPGPFDVVFSDALHTPEGVFSEYENIISNKLDSDFILYFDDLDFPGLFSTAKNIYYDLENKYEEIYFTTFKVYGWVGQFEKMHKNGIISNLNFYDIFKKNKVYLPKLSLIEKKLK